MVGRNERNIYFIGITLPANVSQVIEAIQQELYSPSTMMQPLVPHITLLHPPSLEEIPPDELLPKVKKAAETHLPLTIELIGVDYFDGTVGFITADSLGIYSLQEQLLGLLPEKARVVHYKRPFRPHVTLAQMYAPHKLDKERVQKAVKQKLQLPVTISITSLTYFQRIVPRDYKTEAI